MANVDPFDIEFDDEQPKTEKPKRSVNAFERALKKLPDKFQKIEKPTMRQMLYNNPNDAEKFSEINVPEIDTKVVDLPKEDENEKELIVEHNDTATEPTVEPTTEPSDMTVAEPSDKTIAEPAPQEENIELENFDESEVIEPPTEENSVSEEEVGDIEPETPKEEPKEEKGEEKKEGEKDEEEPVMTDEEALAEAQEMAQDDLVGFKVTGKNWSKMTDKQKAEAIKAFKDKNKVEDHSTDINNNETNNFESYKRYPTALRVAEDLAGAGGKIIEGAGDVAGTEIGGTGANMISERAKGVPHYDYTSLFGRR